MRLSSDLTSYQIDVAFRAGDPEMISDLRAAVRFAIDRAWAGALYDDEPRPHEDEIMFNKISDWVANMVPSYDPGLLHGELRDALEETDYGSHTLFTFYERGDSAELSIAPQLAQINVCQDDPDVLEQVPNDIMLELLQEALPQAEWNPRYTNCWTSSWVETVDDWKLRVNEDELREWVYDRNVELISDMVDQDPKAAGDIFLEALMDHGRGDLAREIRKLKPPTEVLASFAVAYFEDGHEGMQIIEEAVGYWGYEGTRGEPLLTVTRDDLRELGITQGRWWDGAPWTLLNLPKEELAYEGTLQRHCVGRHDMGYRDAVENGEIWIWSLRSAANKPILTFEVDIGTWEQAPGPEQRAHAITQLKGKVNRVPPKNAEENAVLMHVFERLDVSPELVRDFQGGSVYRGRNPPSPSRSFCEPYRAKGARIPNGCPPCEHRHHNPTAQREAIDPISGAVATPDYPGTYTTGRKFVRVRPPGGGAYVEVPFESDSADSARDRFGIDPHYDAMYEADAAAAAKKRRGRGKPRRRDDDPPTPRKLGLRETFDDVANAVAYFTSLNEGLFHFGGLDSADVRDVTYEFMDRLESREGGGKMKRLSRTRAGREILDARSDQEVVEKMLRYLFGTSPRRRWDEIPWSFVTDYLEQVGVVVEEAMDRLRAGAVGVAGVETSLRYPVESGLLEPSVYADELVRAVGPDKARLYTDYLNSQAAFSAADALGSILRPRENDVEAKRLRACLDEDVLSTLRKRQATFLHWAKYPREIPDWACVARSGEAELCSFPGVGEDILRINQACETPYQPNWWRDAQRAIVLSQGNVGLYASGLHPETYEAEFSRAERLRGAPEVELDEPWDLDEPWLEQEAPFRVANRRRRANGGDDMGAEDRRARLAAARDFPENLLPDVLYQVIPERYWRGQIPFDPVTDRMVRIYRSVPAHVTEIRPGDWVALSREYAGQLERGRIISKFVPANHVMWAGTDINEWFYTPPG